MNDDGLGTFLVDMFFELFGDQAMEEDSWKTTTICVLLLIAAAGIGMLILENCT